MPEYYAISPSSDFFMHYGVKGMKWGVRKAASLGSVAGAKALAKHYAKAQKKLSRLDKKANIEFQKAEGRKALKRAGIATGIAATGLGAGIGLKKFAGSVLKKATTAVPFDNLKQIDVKPVTIQEDKIHETFIREQYIPQQILRENATTWENAPIKGWTDPVSASGAAGAIQGTKGIQESLKRANRYSQIGKAAKIAGLGALGYAGYNAGKSIAAAYRRSPKGHAKAVAKRNEWRNHMMDTFKGTPYASLPSVQKKKKRRS